MKHPTTSIASTTVLIPGTMKVIECKGENGKFNIGELSTALGDFKVADQWLEQFDPGIYKGDFRISRIEPRSRVWRGRVFIEVRAMIVDFALETDTDLNADQLDKPAEALVPAADPVDETPSHQPRQPSTRRTAPATSQLPKQQAGIDAISTQARTAKPRVRTQGNVQDTELAPQTPTPSDVIIRLFGEQISQTIAAGIESVKLDPTVDRVLFREQRDWLREHRYSFNMTNQEWMPPTR
jgi:hypothetical protein